MKVLKKAYSIDFQEALKALDATSDGLSEDEVEKRQEIFGKNVLEEKEKSKWLLFFRQFHNVLIYVLVVASLISVFTQRYVDFFVIIGLVFVNALISFWQEIKAHVSIKALKKLTASTETVIRNGKKITILSSELVPGDYVWIQEGDTISADIRLCESTSLQIDESSLTGESLPVIKDHSEVLPETTLPNEQTNMLFAGTTAVRGRGKGVVVATAKNTYFASIAETIKEEPPMSPLTKAISYFARSYLYILIGLFALVGIYGFFQGRKLIDISYILIAELVSAVPEGLPIVVTLVLVIGAIALSRKKTLIRYLPAVETLGSANVIAIDKTGTITEGNVRVSDFYAKDEENLRLCASLCNDHLKGHFDPIDKALFDWTENVEDMQKKHERIWSYPFDVKMRMMAVACSIEGKSKLLVKGAFETIEKMDENIERRKEIKQVVDEMSKKGLRTLVFAEGDFTSQNPSHWKAQIVGVIGFLDPAKEGVKQAVIEAKKAGIHVMMITGDYPATAIAIATDVDICKKDDAILTGKEIDEMDDNQLFDALKKTTVLARSLPEHKYRIVKLLQQRKKIVAVGGDGVNDVPALKAADLGVAMGDGTEAAISVSKMVIKDNNLSVIIEAIKNGRIIADNIRKVIYYLLSSALQEITLITMAILGGFPLPLSPIQILWINLVTDGVQDKTFAFAKEEGKVMQRKPRPFLKQFFDRAQIIRVVSFGLIMGVASLFLFRYLLAVYSYEKAISITFTSVVMVQWFNGIQAQKENEPFFKNIKRSITVNPLIYLGVAAGLVLQLFAVYVAGSWFHTTTLTLAEWKYPIYLSIIAFGVVEVRKWIEYFGFLRRRKKA